MNKNSEKDRPVKGDPEPSTPTAPRPPVSPEIKALVALSWERNKEGYLALKDR